MCTRPTYQWAYCCPAGWIRVCWWACSPARRAVCAPTYSIGFESLGADTEKADEFEYSDLVAQAFGTRHHKLSIPNIAVLERLPQTTARMTEPMFSHDVVAFDLLAERVGSDVKSVLAGYF